MHAEENEAQSERCNALLNCAVHCCNVSCAALLASHTYHRGFGALEMQF